MNVVIWFYEAGLFYCYLAVCGSVYGKNLGRFSALLVSVESS